MFGLTRPLRRFPKNYCFARYYVVEPEKSPNQIPKTVPIKPIEPIEPIEPFKVETKTRYVMPRWLKVVFGIAVGGGVFTGAYIAACFCAGLFGVLIIVMGYCFLIDIFNQKKF